MLLRHQGCCVYLFLAGVLILVDGCTGIPTANERPARADLERAQSVYRPQPDEAKAPGGGLPTQRPKPVLPSLTPDSTLSDLVQYAVLNNPRAESAFYEWKAAVEAITTARALPDPMLTFGAEVSRGMSSLTAGLMTDPAASWPGPGKLSLRADAAYEESLRRRAVFEGQLLATALAVKRAYYQLWTLDKQVRWVRDALAVVNEMEALARERLATGAVTQQDVLRAQMERDRLKTEIDSLQDSRTPIATRLRSALGITPQEALPVTALRLEPTPADFTEETLLDVAFERNPRLKEMRSEVLQAVSLFHLARKSSVPDVSFGLSAAAPPSVLMPSAGITLPIWRDKIAAEIGGARAQVHAAQARLSAEELELAVQFAEAAFAWREADRNAKLYADRLLPKAKASLESARAGYTGGITDFLDLLEAERTLLDYHVNHTIAVAEREIVLAEISLVILGRRPEGVSAILSDG